MTIHSIIARRTEWLDGEHDSLADSPARPELAATLRRLRQDAGLSGIEAARRAGLSQPTVSRLETGRRAPTVKEVTALCKAYRAPAEIRAGLLAIARNLQEGTTSARIVLQRPREMQERIGRIEQSSALVRSFQPAMVIGLAQTLDYAQAMMSGRVSGDTLEQLTQSRRQRQAILDTDRQFTLVHAEGALRWHIGSPAIMAAQLDHLAELTRRPNIRLGVIPWDRPLTMHARHAFHLYDTHTVIVGTESGTAFITDPVEVRAYDCRFAELEGVAVFGDEAREVFTRIAGEYRDLA
ncbi:MAG: helix-turn-helix domain-containing protein [Actinomycetota bacterium]|nr:helix-turn-helix domain-containing protein [Actinomycetota bacterium]